MIFFQQEGFEEYYRGILEGKESSDFYIDPDCIRDIEKTNYYYLLTLFLKSREQKCIGKLSFLPPKCSGSISAGDAVANRVGEKADGKDDETADKTADGKDDETADKTADEKTDKKADEKADAYKIMVLEDGNPLFMLTSDQYGFSAIERIYSDRKKSAVYPLSRLLLLTEKESEEELEDTKELLVTYVRNTRTMGGAFVWPTDSLISRNCSYNVRRGISSYIEDRVDLTLLEIKHALDGEYDLGNHSSDILFREYTDPQGPMRAWLSHFGSFDEYIRFFMLEGFTEDGMPIDILSGKPLTEESAAAYKQDSELRISKQGPDKLKEMLLRLEKMILDRTGRMEEEIRRLQISEGY